MNRVFVILPLFDRLWAEAGLSDAELAKLQTYLLTNPKAGDVYPGLAGLRKVRWKLPGIGKSRSIRVLYLDLEGRHLVFFLSLVKKNERSDLAPLEKQILRKLIASIKDEYKRRGHA